MKPAGDWQSLTKQERQLLREYLACKTNCVKAYSLESAKWCQH